MPIESSRAFLLQTADPGRVTEIRAALTRNRVVHETAIIHANPPSVAFLVAASQLELARETVSALFVDETPPPDSLEFSRLFSGRPQDPSGPPDGDRTDDPSGASLAPVDERLRGPYDGDPEFSIDDDEDEREQPLPPHPFPAVALQWATGLALLHLSIVFWAASPWNPGFDLPRAAGLIDPLWRSEPWRLLTYLLVHADPKHAFWNGVPLVVFSVPLIEAVGIPRVSLIYVTAGIVGGLVGLSVVEPGTILIGSSGAVAGIFGGWITLTLRQSRIRGRGWRGPIRTWGVALLFLPSLIQPVTADGNPISVGAHMGGWITGMLVGALIGRWVWRQRDATAEFSSPTAPGFREDR